jgi:hypothetical protein
VALAPACLASSRPPLDAWMPGFAGCWSALRECVECAQRRTEWRPRS